MSKIRKMSLANARLGRKLPMILLLPSLWGLSGCLGAAADETNANAVDSTQQPLWGDTLLFGSTYFIQNGYSGWTGGYLDTRGPGCEGNLLCVSTATTPRRDSGSGSWTIVSPVGKAPGTPVLPGDDISLINQYGARSYLDTRDSRCEGNLYCVSTAWSPNRDYGSGTWRVLPSSTTSGPILEGQAVHLLNGYSNFGGGFLDTRGAGCEGNKYCVSTSALWNRNTEGTSDWRFRSSSL
jgi:hypothetical protein